MPAPVFLSLTYLYIQTYLIYICNILKLLDNSVYNCVVNDPHTFV